MAAMRTVWLMVWIVGKSSVMHEMRRPDGDLLGCQRAGRPQPDIAITLQVDVAQVLAGGKHGSVTCGDRVRRGRFVLLAIFELAVFELAIFEQALSHPVRDAVAMSWKDKVEQHDLRQEDPPMVAKSRQ